MATQSHGSQDSAALWSLTRAVPGRGARWTLQLLIDEDRRTLPLSAAMVTTAKLYGGMSL